MANICNILYLYNIETLTLAIIIMLITKQPKKNQKNYTNNSTSYRTSRIIDINVYDCIALICIFYAFLDSENAYIRSKKEEQQQQTKYNKSEPGSILSNVSSYKT